MSLTHAAARVAAIAKYDAVCRLLRTHGAAGALDEGQIREIERRAAREALAEAELMRGVVPPEVVP